MEYKQKTVEELKNIPKNGYKVVSLFAGGGGSSMGYMTNGYEIKTALEFDDNAVQDYRANFPEANIIKDDIRNINGEFILKQTGLKKYELDILDGSPPCDSFSMAGPREDKWGKKKNYGGKVQRTDDLFFEYLRILKDLMPKVFIAENVKGITIGNAREYMKQIIEKAESIGYNVECKVLNASDYGVPQNRERAFFIGVRKDLGLAPSYPAIFSEKVTTKDAIEDLIDNPVGYSNLTPDRNALATELGFECSAKQIKDYSEKTGRKIYVSYYIRDFWNKPCHTLTAREMFLHPLRNRPIAENEGLRLQSFPDDYKLTHSHMQNWRRLGMSVPPKLMEAVSKEVKINILDKIKNYPIEKAEKFFSHWADTYNVKILGSEIKI